MQTTEEEEQQQQIQMQPVEEEIQMEKKSPAMQRKCAECEKEEEQGLQRKPMAKKQKIFLSEKGSRRSE